MITKYLSRLLSVALCSTFFALHAAAADPSATIPEKDVTLPAIKTFFDAAFIKAEFAKNGDLKIEDGGVKTYIRLDNQKKLITFFSVWGLKESVPEIKKLQLVNSLNDELILARFVMSTPTALWCDYQFFYEGGITPFEIVNNYRMFNKVTRGAVETKNSENIIGSE